jgi:hypothetical protein
LFRAYEAFSFAVFLSFFLYFLPMIILLHYWIITASSRTWNSGFRYFVLSSKKGVILGTVSITLILVNLILFNYHLPDHSIRNMILRHKSTILEAGREHDIDPALIASIIYVENHDHVSPFRRSLEGILASAWLSDNRNAYGIMSSLNFSLGICQIKPVTAHTALCIPDLARDRMGTEEEYLVLSWSGGKQDRDLPDLKGVWALSRSETAALSPPFRLNRLWEIIHWLRTEDKCIQMCAYILSLYAAQWHASNPDWSIRDRPDILATLYQIGFEKSVPHPHPRSNRYGKRVFEVFNDPWIQANF